MSFPPCSSSNHKTSASFPQATPPPYLQFPQYQPEGPDAARPFLYALPPDPQAFANQSGYGTLAIESSSNSNLQASDPAANMGTPNTNSTWCNNNAPATLPLDPRLEYIQGNSTQPLSNIDTNAFYPFTVSPNNLQGPVPQIIVPSQNNAFSSNPNQNHDGQANGSGEANQSLPATVGNGLPWQYFGLPTPVNPTPYPSFFNYQPSNSFPNYFNVLEAPMTTAIPSSQFAPNNAFFSGTNNPYNLHSMIDPRLLTVPQTCVPNIPVSAFNHISHSSTGNANIGAYMTETQAAQNMFANQANPGVYNSQHLTVPQYISMTGHTAFANMPIVKPPSTSGASSIGNPTNGNAISSSNIPWGEPFRPTPTYPSNGPSTSTIAIPPSRRAQPKTPSSRPPRVLRKPRTPRPSAAQVEGPRRPTSTSPSNTRDKSPVLVASDDVRPHRLPTRKPQLFPSQELWEKIGPSKWACRYKGPAAPHGCSSVLSSSRNLGRHMRETHALAELAMDLPQDQRTAYNSMPDGLRLIHVKCPYEDKDLHRCRFYRENGQRWEMKGQRRKDVALRAHIAEYHPADERVRYPKRKRKQGS